MFSSSCIYMHHKKHFISSSAHPELNKKGVPQHRGRALAASYQACQPQGLRSNLPSTCMLTDHRDFWRQSFRQRVMHAKLDEARLGSSHIM